MSDIEEKFEFLEDRRSDTTVKYLRDKTTKSGPGLRTSNRFFPSIRSQMFLLPESSYLNLALVMKPTPNATHFKKIPNLIRTEKNYGLNLNFEFMLDI